MDASRLPGIEKFRTWWTDITPERKRAILLVLIVGGIFAASAVFKKDRATKPLGAQNQPKLDMSVITPSRKEEGVQELRAAVDTLKTQLATATSKMEGLQKQQDLQKETGQQQQSTQVNELARDLANVKEDVRAYKSDVLSGPAPGKNLPIPALPEAPKGGSDDKSAAPAVHAPKIRISGQDDQTASAQSTKASGGPVVGAKDATTSAPSGGKTPDAKTDIKLATNNPALNNQFLQFIPAGTFMKGILLNGIDAPTSSMAQKQPVPAVMRIKTLAFLPNRVTQDIRECFIVLSGYGVMSSERANMRTETISCIRNDGGVIEAPLDGFAVGDDGKQGLRGQLVTKQGALIARSLAANFISGFGNAMKPSSVMGISTSPGSSQQWQTPDVGMALQSGALTGVGQAANDVAKFYLDTAKEMYPVVEIPSESEITVVLVRGASLALGQSKTRSSNLSR